MGGARVNCSPLRAIMSGGKQVVISTLTHSRLQDEETRRAERNRAVFEAWLEKKREERKVILVHEAYQASSLTILERTRFEDGGSSQRRRSVGEGENKRHRTKSV